MDLHIYTNRDNRGSRIHWDSSLHSHSLLALLLPSSASPPICSYSFSGDNVSREAKRSKWHRENGKKGKGNNTLQKKPHYWGLLLSEFSKASPFPSSICLSCTLEAVTQKLCLLLPVPAAKVWGQLWGPETAWFMNSKKRVLLEPASGSQRPRNKNSWKITVFVQVRCRQLCCLSELYFAVLSWNVSQRCDLYWARHHSNFLLK